MNRELVNSLHLQESRRDSEDVVKPGGVYGMKWTPVDFVSEVEGVAVSKILRNEMDTLGNPRGFLRESRPFGLCPERDRCVADTSVFSA